MATIPPPDQYRFRDPRQDRIYRRLLLVGQNAAAFYRDVCRLLDGAARLETAAHTIAHNLREIESALRAVLLPLVDPAKLEEATRRGKNKGHQQQVEAVLEVLGLADVPAAAETWRRLADPEGESGLARLAHRDALAGPRTLSEPFRRIVDDIQELLDLVLARFETRYLAYVRRLDVLLGEATPSDDDIKGLRNEIPNSPATLGYFFDRLLHPAWLAPLRDTGFFRHPPEPIRDDKRTAFPPWPVSRYLARMAAVREVQETVLEIALEVPLTDNVRVHEDLADVALALPPGLAERLVPRAKDWISSPYQILLAEKLGDLVSHLARGGRREAAVELASAVLEIRAAPRGPILGPDGEVLHRPEAVGHFDLWRYERILNRNVPDLVDAAGLEAFNLLCDLLEAAVRLSRAREDDPGPEDYSYIWRPSIEEHAQNRGETFRGALVTAVRRVAESLGRCDPSLVLRLVRLLEKRPWRVFRRLALHLLRVFPEGTASLAAERLTAYQLFETVGLQREYRLLLRDRFRELSPADQAVILGWIEAGPDREEVRVGLAELHGAPPTDADIDRYVNGWRADHLAVLVPQLSEGWQQRYTEWRGEGPEPEHPEFPVHVSGWHGSRSPKSVEELRGMTVEEIVDFLRGWRPPEDRWAEPSRAGLEMALTAAVEAEPARFRVEASRFEGVDPGYVAALLWGLRTGVRDRPGWDWQLVLDLCERVARQRDDAAGAGGRKRQSKGARKAAASLLEQGLSAGAGEIPISLRARVWRALEPLTEDPDPTLEDEARFGGNRLDAANFAINTVRGEAMHGVVRYALWVRRHLEHERDGAERLARGFDEMPEVRSALEAHLDPARDPSLAARAVYGQWFPWLVLLDPRWAVTHVTTIFSHDPALVAHRDAAWTAYATLCDPYDNILDLLRDEYRLAAERLGTGPPATRAPGDPEEQLADHVMTFYARGRLSLEDPRDPLAAFYERAPVRLRRHALASIAVRLRHERKPLRPDIRDRLKRLWSARLEAARAASDPRQYAPELEAFGWWFASGSFDDAWVFAQLEQVLEIAGRVDSHHEVIGRLAKVSRKMPRAAVVCIRYMVEGDVEGWVVHGSSDEIRVVARNGLKDSNAETRRATADLVNVLVARGYPQFKDLLES